MKLRMLRASIVALIIFCLSLFVLAPVAGATSQTTKTAALPLGGQLSQLSGSGSALPQQASTKSIAQTHSTKPAVQHPALRSLSKDVAPAIATSGAVAISAPVQQKQAGVKPSVTVNSSFQGISDTGWSPSDSTNAAGPYNVLETVNEQFTIYTRGGSAQYSTTFNSWFGRSGSLFDPRVVYDVWGGRFIFLVDTGSSFLVAVSRQSNALGNYCNYTFPTIAGFADYPSLGVDYNGVYVSFNMFNSSNKNELFKIDRNALESCSSANYWTWSNLTDATGASAFTIAPAVGYTYDTQEYMVSSRPGGACSLTQWILNGLSLYKYNVATRCYSPPSAAAQKGSAATIETLDNRIYSANYLNGQIDVALTGAYNWGSGNNNSVFWFFKLNKNATLAQQGGYGTPGYWYFFPSIQQDANGHAIVVYNSSGASTYVNVWYAALNTDGSLTSNNALVWGSNYYGTSGTSRWGDYQSARLDPTSSTQIWLCGQYARAANSWGTWNGDVSY